MAIRYCVLPISYPLLRGNAVDGMGIVTYHKGQTIKRIPSSHDEGHIMESSHIEKLTHRLSIERDIQHDKYCSPSGDNSTNRVNDFGLTKIEKPLMRSVSGAITATQGFNFSGSHLFGVDRQSAYAIQKLDGNYGVKRGSFKNEKLIIKATEGIPFENLLLLVIVPSLIFPMAESEEISAFIGIALAAFIVLFLSVKAFREVVALYAFKQFPSTIHLGTSKTMSELMDRIIAIAVDDNDHLWDDYERITSLMVGNNDYLHTHYQNYRDINTDLRSKEVMVIAALVNELDDKITYREKFIEDAAVDIEDMEQAVVSAHEENLNGILDEYGISEKQLEENARYVEINNADLTKLRVRGHTIYDFHKTIKLPANIVKPWKYSIFDGVPEQNIEQNINDVLHRLLEEELRNDVDRTSAIRRASEELAIHIHTFGILDDDYELIRMTRRLLLLLDSRQEETEPALDVSKEEDDITIWANKMKDERELRNKTRLECSESGWELSYLPYICVVPRSWG